MTGHLNYLVIYWLRSHNKSVVPLQLLEGEFDVFFNDETNVAIAFITKVTSAILVLDNTQKHIMRKACHSIVEIFVCSRR